MNMTLFILSYLSVIKCFFLNRPVFIKLLRNCSIIVIVFLSSFCKKDPAYEIPLPPYAEIESTIRSKYDSYAVFKWDQYVELLNKLSQDKFMVLPLNEMRNTFNDTKVTLAASRTRSMIAAGMSHHADQTPRRLPPAHDLPHDLPAATRTSPAGSRSPPAPRRRRTP